MTVLLILAVAACKKETQYQTETNNKPKKSWDETSKTVATDVSKKLNSLSNYGLYTKL